jgi:hypothetical protein
MTTDAATSPTPSVRPDEVDRQSDSTRSFLLGGLLPALALPALGFTLYSSTGRDDAYLTYWPAHTLATMGNIVNYNGERIEQSSSLLLTVVLAVGNRVSGISIPTLGYALGVLAGSTTVLLVWLTARKLTAPTAWMAASLAATSTPIVYWSFSGMEAPLVPALLLVVVLAGARYLTGAVANARRDLAVSVVAIAAFTIVRPEAGFVLIAVFGALVLASLLLRGKRAEWGAPQVRRSLVLAGVAVLALGAVTAARLLYFGAAFPNPVSAKANGVQLEAGVDYVVRAVRETSPSALAIAGIPFAALGIVGVVRIARRPGALGVLVASATLVQLGFVVMVGGDWMEGGRFLVTTAALASVLVAVGIEAVPGRAMIAIALIALQVGGAINFAERSSTGSPAWTTPSTPDTRRSGHNPYAWYERQNRTHLRDTTVIEPLALVIDEVARHVDGPVTVASSQAGMVPYYVFQRGVDAEFIDVRGLATDTLSRCPGYEATGPLGMGHGLSETLALVFAYEKECGVPRPDVIYGLDDFPAEVQAEYQLVHQQLGRSVNHSSWLPGELVPARAFVAVRKDLGEHFPPFRRPARP